MKKIFNRYMLICLSGALALLGVGSCKTTKISKKQQLRQEQAYRDSLEAAKQQAFEEEVRRKMINDSLQMEERRRNQTKTIYAGPNMMDRRGRLTRPDSI